MASPKKLILYGAHISPPTRAVRMTLAALNIDYEFKIVDFKCGGLQTPEFLAKNPQHTVPTLELEDGRCIWDSHAIMAYLVRKYGKDDSLYPKDYYQRAIVDQRLHYENGILFEKVAKQTIAGVLHNPATKAQFDEMVQSLYENYDMLETLVGDNQYMAGNKLTIADLSIITTVSAFDLIAPIVAAKHPKLAAWYALIKKLPYYGEVNNEGNKTLEEMFKERIGQMS